MNFHALCSEADRVHLDCVLAEVAMLELELRSTEADASADAAFARMLELAAS